MKENRAYIRRNKNRREGKNDPNFNGSANIAGIEYWISAWMDDDTDREGNKNGEKVLSCTFKPKEQQNSAPQASAPVPDDDGWDI